MTVPVVERMREAPAAGPDLDTALVLNALPQPIFVIDAAGRFAQVNLAAEQFFRTGASALLGRALVEVIPAVNIEHGSLSSRPRGGCLRCTLGVDM